MNSKLEQEELLSVIICAHNPKIFYLNQVLEALKSQILPNKKWELILVDNASIQPLSTCVDLSWHPLARHVHESELGKVPAFLCGIRESKGRMLIMVDDDNVLAPDYLSIASQYYQEKPWLGAFSGQCEGVFDFPPPKWAVPLFPNLAIRTFDRDCWSNLPDIEQTMPNGAGMCMRREVADHYRNLYLNGKRPFKLDRIGKNILLSGGDNDLAACATDLGLGIGVFSGLKLKHLIPPERLREDYLLRLTEGIAYSGVIVHSFRGIQKPLPSIGRKLLDFVKLFFMRGRERRFFLANQRGAKKARIDLSKMRTL